MLTWGIIAGVVAMFASLKAIGQKQPNWMYRWFRPWSANGQDGFLRRVKLALSPANHLYVLPLFSPFFFVLAIWLFSSTGAFGFSFNFLSGALIGYAGALLVAYPLDLTKSLSSFRREVAIFAAQKLVRRMPPEVSNAILVPLAKSSDPGLRIAAAMGLRELGTKEGSEALRLLGEDADVFVATASRDAYIELKQVYLGNGLLSVRTMDTYVTEHAWLVQRLRGKRKGAEYVLNREKFDEITRQIDEIVYSQLPLRRSYPDIFCKDCYARAEHLHYEEWDWVRCRQCKEVHGLKPGILTVVGQIGGEQEWEAKDGVLRVNLWDEANRKGHAADLEVLEVIGGKNINYDWAVSAVVDKLHNMSLGVGSRISVKLIGDPVLEPNTYHLLRTLDQSMILAK